MISNQKAILRDRRQSFGGGEFKHPLAIKDGKPVLAHQSSSRQIGAHQRNASMSSSGTGTPRA
jgi:hypothetical protein